MVTPRVDDVQTALRAKARRLLISGSIGYGYVTSRMGMIFTGDPRDVALRDALYASVRHS